MDLILIHASSLEFFHLCACGEHVHSYQDEREFPVMLISLDINIWVFNNFAFNEVIEIKPKDKIIGNRCKIN